MERCTSQNEPVCTGIRLEFSNESDRQLVKYLMVTDSSPTIKVLEPMSLVHHNVLPQEPRQELPVVHTDLVGGHNDREGHARIASRLV